MTERGPSDGWSSSSQGNDQGIIMEQLRQRLLSQIEIVPGRLESDCWIFQTSTGHANLNWQRRTNHARHQLLSISAFDEVADNPRSRLNPSYNTLVELCDEYGIAEFKELLLHARPLD